MQFPAWTEIIIPSLMLKSERVLLVKSQKIKFSIRTLDLSKSPNLSHNPVAALASQFYVLHLFAYLVQAGETYFPELNKAFLFSSSTTKYTTQSNIP